MPQLNDYHATDCALNEHHDGPCINDDGLSDYDGPDDHFPDLNCAADIVDHATRNDHTRSYDPAVYVLVRRDDLDHVRACCDVLDQWPNDLRSTIHHAARTLLDNARTVAADVARDRS